MNNRHLTSFRDRDGPLRERVAQQALAAPEIRLPGWLRPCRMASCTLVFAALAHPIFALEPAGSQQDAVISLLKKQDEAVLRIGEQLAVRGRAYCAGSGRSAGMTVQRIGQYGADYRLAAARVLGIGLLPTITAVAPGGAAESAGLRPGDAIAAIDDRAFSPESPTARAGDFAATDAMLDVIAQALEDGIATLRVIGGGVERRVRLVARPACRARFDVRAGQSNNASSDGIYVQVSSDLVERARDDGELAAILAHELAHNILHHPQRLTGPRPRPKVRVTEIEADRLSVYLLDAAGYSPAGAIAFWERWGRANDLGILSDRSHPGWKDRVRTIETEAALISAQRATGRPVRAPADLAPR